MRGRTRRRAVDTGLMKDNCNAQRSNQKRKYDTPSPGSTSTTVSSSPASLMASPLSTVSSRTNCSRDDRTIKNMSSLTVQSHTTYEEGDDKFNSNVNSAPIDLKKVRYVNGIYTNKHHLLALLKKKKTTTTKKRRISLQWI